MSFLKTWIASAPTKVALPAWMPRLAFAPQGQAPRGDVLVVVFQRGGMDGLNALVPAGDSDYYRLRPKLAIPEPKAGDDNAAIDLDGFFALLPNLRPLKPIYDARQLAPVHAVGSPDPTHSHFDAMDTMERGTPGAKSLVSGWIGRHLAAFNSGNDSPLRAVGIGSMVQAALRGPVPATALKSIADFHYQGRQQDLSQFQQTLAALYMGQANGLPHLAAAAQQVDDTIALLSKVNVDTYTPVAGAHYPDSDFGRGMAQIAQLIKAEVGLEVACVDIGGWDTHANQGGAEGQLAGLLEECAHGLAALWQDLGEGIKRVTIVTMSEFGRRAAENGSGGTDHGHANAMFLIGGNVVGGKVHGEWPTLADDKLDGPGDLALTTDYRDILSEVLTKRVGNTALKDVFPQLYANDAQCGAHIVHVLPSPQKIMLEDTPVAETRRI